MSNIFALWASGYLTLALLMACAWHMARKKQNAAWVDVAWGYGFAFLVPLYSLQGGGYSVRRLLASMLILIWSLRLGTHLFLRTYKSTTEDRRYHLLRQGWTHHFSFKLFLFFQLQAVLLAFLSTPIIVIMINPQRYLSVWEWLASGLFIIGILGESMADRQLMEFKSNPDHHDQVCQTGLWRYSRHPNYFFEWVNWCALFVFALASRYGWLYFYVPLLMYFILRRLTGVSLTERSLLQSKGAAYQKYQQTTNAFFPGPTRASL